MPSEHQGALGISTDQKIESERLVLLLIIGIATALQEKLISIDEAERYLFSPFTMHQLEQSGINREIVDIIHLGTELENVQSLLPDNMVDSIDRILTLALAALKELPKSNHPIRIWMDKQGTTV